MKIKFLIFILFFMVDVLSAQSFSSISKEGIRVSRKGTEVPAASPCLQSLKKGSESDRSFATIGAGGSSGGGTTITPFSTYWHDGQHQYLFTAAELTAAGLSGNNIDGLGWNISSANSASFNGFNIGIKHTTATSVTGWETGFTNVYYGTYVAFAGWNDFTFSIPWAWNGTDNVLFKVCFDNSGYTSNSTCYYDDYATYYTGYMYGDNAAGCTDSYEGNTISRPQTRFSYS